MDKLTEIINFIMDFSGIDEINPDSDISNLSVEGDDFHELIDKYSETFKVDMTEYLWYFHTHEEGQNIGALFFKPPYSRVERIPVTPRLLTGLAKARKWAMKYPEHKLPKKRIDITINQILVIICIIVAVLVWILK